MISAFTKYFMNMKLWSLFNKVFISLQLHVKPIRAFPVAFYYSLVLICFRGRFIFIQNNRLYSRSAERSAFHDGDLLSYHCRLLPDFFIAESTQSMLQFHVATLWTRLNVVLEKQRKTRINCCLLQHSITLKVLLVCIMLYQWTSEILPWLLSVYLGVVFCNDLLQWFFSF